MKGQCKHLIDGIVKDETYCGINFEVCEGHYEDCENYEEDELNT